MRLPVNSLVAVLRRSAGAAREARAADLYSAEKLRAAMMEAAGQGFDTAVIRGPEGVDLSETAAAGAAEAWLAGERIAFEWKHRDGAGGVDAASCYDLVLSWKVPVKA